MKHISFLLSVVMLLGCACLLASCGPASMITVDGYEFLMNEDEYDEFQALDNTVTVYRGVTSHNAKNVKALSWTLSYDTADWFAHRFGEDGTVYEAQIDRRHIYAYFNRRNEHEVIVDPKYLMDITEAETMDQIGEISM